jgi:hypothetical protein
LKLSKKYFLNKLLHNIFGFGLLLVSTIGYSQVSCFADRVGEKPFPVTLTNDAAVPINISVLQKDWSCTQFSGSGNPDIFNVTLPPGGSQSFLISLKARNNPGILGMLTFGIGIRDRVRPEYSIRFGMQYIDELTPKVTFILTAPARSITAPVGSRVRREAQTIPTGISNISMVFSLGPEKGNVIKFIYGTSDLGVE